MDLYSNKIFMSSFDIDLIAIIYIIDIGIQNNSQSRENAAKDIIHREVENLMLIHARGYKDHNSRKKASERDKRSGLGRS
jgi:hypothetical protein